MAMKKYLVDTDILIYALAGKSPWAKQLERWIKNKQVVFSAITVAEFLAGALPEEKVFFEALLDKLGSLPVDTSIARIAADIRQKLLPKKKIRLPDCLIAATCLFYDLVLVTNNIEDFRKVPGLQIYSR